MSYPCKLSPLDVATARELARQGYTYRDISRHFDVDRSTLSMCIRGVTHAGHSTPAVSHGCVVEYEHSGRKLSMDAARRIRALAAVGESIRSMAREFGVDRGTIRKIIRGETYRETT